MAKQAIKQPDFDLRIKTLAFPLSGGHFGQLQRGFMVWEKPVSGYSDKAMVNFLYNPSSVTADYAITDASVASALLFPTGFNDINLRVPLSQSVAWSLLFDRTYELWGAYDSQGLPLKSNGPGENNPAVVGVLADVMAMQQFTGMFVAYSTGHSDTTSPNSTTSLTGWQGIMQMIPSWVYFGGNSAQNSLWYYGYISEWDVTITHWTQYMVPSRCVINITFTMLPPPMSSNSSKGRATPRSTGPGVSTQVSQGLTGIGR